MRQQAPLDTRVVDTPTACDPTAGAETCNGNQVVTCNPDGTYGSVVADCGTGMACADANCVNACTADGVDLVYVVTQEMDLLSFDPRRLPADPFALIGRLACPVTLPTLMTTPGPVTPFSMSIDRGGKAWIEYTSGEVFGVSITDASCTATAYVPDAANMALFGMGFVTDAADGFTEKLFLAGGGKDPQPGGNLAYVDTHVTPYTPVIVGPIDPVSDVTPELTGTSESRLYVFSPRFSMPSYIQEIDKATGTLLLGTLQVGANGLGGDVGGWAFAFWGGKFYVFVTSDGDSTVRVVDRATGDYSIALTMLPYTIVGAGVSTCAPVLF